MDLEAIARSGVQHRLAALKEEAAELRQWLKQTKKKRFFAGVNLEGASAENNGAKRRGRPPLSAAIELAAPVKKRAMSKKARAAISKAMKARWAKAKKVQG